MSRQSIEKTIRSCYKSPEIMALISSMLTLWILTSIIYFNITAAVILDVLLSIIVGFFVFHLVKLQQKYEHIEYRQATQDPLTSIYNKTYLYDIGRREIKSCLRSQYALSMVIFRIDSYDNTIDLYGEKLVNRALVTLTHNIRQKTRQGDVFARLRDNEFAILCPDSSVETATELARRIQVLTEALVCTYAPGQSIDFTCTVVVTQYSPETDREFSDMITRVEKEINSITEVNQLLIG